MSSPSRWHWIPYAIGAIGVHLLLVAWRLGAEHLAPAIADAPADFVLLVRPPGASIGAPRTPSVGAIRRADAEIAGADPSAYWVGTYAAPTCCPGEFSELLLGTSTYVVTHVGGYPLDRAEPEVLEYGHYTLEADCVHLAPTAVPGRYPQVHELALLRVFGGCLLATYDQVPGAFYDPSKPSSLFPMGCQAHFYQQNCRFERDAAPIVPECYRREWKRVPHLRVEEVFPMGLFDPTAKVRLSSSGAESVPNYSILWWDGEVRTEVRAFVREVKSDEVLAVLDLPEGMNLSLIRIGTTFSRLPRLE